MGNSTAIPALGAPRGLNPLFKIALVLGGYVLAFVFACGLTYLYVSTRPDSVTDPSSGMYAFGDSLYFFGILGVSCIFPTALGLWFLRKNSLFWKWAALAVLAFAATAPLAEAIRSFIRWTGIYHGIFMFVDLFCLLRTLAIPILLAAYGVFLLMAFSVSDLGASKWRIRWAFAIAIVLDAVTGIYIQMLLRIYHRWC